MTRVLGIDWGEKRIGTALSDPDRIIATAYQVLTPESEDATVASIRQIVEEQSVGGVVVGLPLNMDGSFGPQAQKANALADRLRADLPVPVDTWDERLTSRTAESALIEAGTRREKRRQLVDKVAAQVMLQHYLDAHAINETE